MKHPSQSHAHGGLSSSTKRPCAGWLVTAAALCASSAAWAFLGSTGAYPLPGNKPYEGGKACDASRGGGGEFSIAAKYLAVEVIVTGIEARGALPPIVSGHWGYRPRNGKCAMVMYQAGTQTTINFVEHGGKKCDDDKWTKGKRFQLETVWAKNFPAYTSRVPNGAVAGFVVEVAKSDMRDGAQMYSPDIPLTCQSVSAQGQCTAFAPAAMCM